MEPDAFEALVLSQLTFIQQKSRELARNTEDAEDLAQEVLERAIQSEHLFRGGDIRGWLYVMAKNLFLNQRRAASRRVDADSLDDLLEQGQPVELPTQSAELDALAVIFSPDTVTAFRALNARQQQAIYLAYVEDLSMAEVSLRMCVPVSTVTTWLSRARCTMRDTLSAA